MFLKVNFHDSGLSLENCSDKQSASLPEILLYF